MGNPTKRELPVTGNGPPIGWGLTLLAVFFNSPDKNSLNPICGIWTKPLFPRSKGQFRANSNLWEHEQDIQGTPKRVILGQFPKRVPGNPENPLFVNSLRESPLPPRGKQPFGGLSKNPLCGNFWGLKKSRWNTAHSFFPMG